MHPICTIYYRDDTKPDTTQFFELPTSEKIIRDTFKIEDEKYFGIFEGAGLVKHVNPTDRVDVDQLEGGKEYRIRWVVKRDTTKDSTPTTTPDQELDTTHIDNSETLTTPTKETAIICYKKQRSTFALPVKMVHLLKAFNIDESLYEGIELIDRYNNTIVRDLSNIKSNRVYRVFVS
jgi:hypothetical protein